MKRPWLLQLADYYGVDTEADDFVLESIFPALEYGLIWFLKPLFWCRAAKREWLGNVPVCARGAQLFWPMVLDRRVRHRNRISAIQAKFTKCDYFLPMEASIRSYMRNLNTHFAYEELRSMRHQLRLESKSVTATPLTEGLLRYSERGDDYVTELQQMIRVNRPIIQEVGENLTPD